MGEMTITEAVFSIISANIEPLINVSILVGVIAFVWNMFIYALRSFSTWPDRF